MHGQTGRDRVDQSGPHDPDERGDEGPGGDAGRPQRDRVQRVGRRVHHGFGTDADEQTGRAGHEHRTEHRDRPPPPGRERPPDQRRQDPDGRTRSGRTHQHRGGPDRDGGEHVERGESQGLGRAGNPPAQHPSDERR
jgi:hypothetical protein